MSFLNNKKLLIDGPAGKLESLFTSHSDDQPNNVAVICHPHPLHQGTMNNKVVTTLAKFYDGLGMATVRFNFRGVEASEGEYGESVGEIDDLLAVISWVKSEIPDANIHLAGFSFGSFIAASVASKLSEVKTLISIAPPVARFEFAQLNPITIPWIVVQGEADEVVEPSDVFAWYETLDPQPILIRMPDVGHFFHGKLIELRDLLVNKFTY